MHNPTKMNENMEEFCFDSDLNSVDKKVKFEKNGNGISSNPVKSKTEKNHDNANKFQCHLCNEYFDQFELEMHFIECSLGENGIKEENENCENVENNNSCEFDPIKKSRKPNSESEKRFSCQYCDKTFKTSNGLIYHEKTHTGENPFKCDICSKTFEKVNKLEQHYKIHPIENAFKCKWCPKTFPKKYNLQIHAKKSHPKSEKYFKKIERKSKFECKVNNDGKKMYLCNYCEKSFKSPSLVILHERKHTGEKPFKCETCSKSFQFSSNLKNHMLIHTGEKPYKCKFCPKAFNRKDTLVKHNRSHTGERPFQCKICNKAFGHKSVLKSHEKSHSGEKPEKLYKCKLCKKSFTTKKSLKFHEENNTCNRQWKCKKCKKSYTTPLKLATHLSNIHKLY